MRRLFHQIYFSLLAATFLGILLTAVVTHHLLGERPQSPFVERLQAEASVVTQALPPPDAPRDELLRALTDKARQLHLSLALVDARGQTLVTTRAGLEPLHGWPNDERWTLTRSGPILVVPLRDGRRLALRPAGHPAAQLSFLLIVLVLALALALLCHPIARRLTRRLEALERGVERLGAGDLAARVDVDGRDEIAGLAARFNEAAARIERLVKAQRTMLAQASHELRSPLARLRLALELMRDDDASGVARRIDEASGEIAELDELVEDILLSSRLTAGARGPLEELDLADVVTTEAARVGATVVTRRTPLVGEARALRRLVRNLLENARRHGGSAAIEAGVEPTAEATARLWVADRGPGVPAAERERIFAPFYRAPAAQGGEPSGFGLGLALVRQIAEAHGGTVICLDRPGGGTLFEARLPLTPTGGPN
jgi:signal transduction histidine kinase